MKNRRKKENMFNHRKEKIKIFIKGVPAFLMMIVYMTLWLPSLTTMNPSALLSLGAYGLSFGLREMYQFIECEENKLWNRFVLILLSIILASTICGCALGLIKGSGENSNILYLYIPLAIVSGIFPISIFVFEYYKLIRLNMNNENMNETEIDVGNN